MESTAYAVKYDFEMRNKTKTFRVQGSYDGNPQPLDLKTAEQMVEMLNGIYGAGSHWVIALNEPVDDNSDQM